MNLELNSFEDKLPLHESRVTVFRQDHGGVDICEAGVEWYWENTTGDTTMPFDSVDVATPEFDSEGYSLKIRITPVNERYAIPVPPNSFWHYEIELYHKLAGKGE